MSVIRNDWLKAQDLLVQLVRILSPIAKTGSEYEPVLSGSFFIPSEQSLAKTGIAHPVFILKAASEQVSQLIEQLPETQQDFITAKEQLNQSVAAKTNIQTSVFSQPPSVQAKKLIDQVRDAICTLCTSSNMVDPKPAPLRQALLKLKPQLEEMVKAVTYDGVERPGDEKPIAYRLTASSRIPVARISLIANTSRQVVVTAATDTPRKAKIEPERQPDPVLEKEEGRQAKTFAQIVSAGESQMSLRQPSEIEVRIAHRIAPLCIPFTPQIQNLTLPRRKKKRKGFWFREDEENESKS